MPQPAKLPIGTADAEILTAARARAADLAPRVTIIRPVPISHGFKSGWWVVSLDDGEPRAVFASISAHAETDDDVKLSAARAFLIENPRLA